MFIVLEGIDGCGKTTQARRLTEWLYARGREIVSTFEPGDWPGGPRMREMLLNGDFESAWSEFFLFMADRCEHACRVIEPALRAGKIVLSDRYTPSSIAYQIYGNPDLTDETRRRVSRIPSEIGLPEPDVVVWFDIDVETAHTRLGSREKRDAFDARGQDFSRRVRGGYEALSKEPGACWVTVDASRDEDAVFASVVAALEPFFEERLPCR